MSAVASQSATWVKPGGAEPEDLAGHQRQCRHRAEHDLDDPVLLLLGHRLEQVAAGDEDAHHEDQRERVGQQEGARRRPPPNRLARRRHGLELQRRAAAGRACRRATPSARRSETRVSSATSALGVCCRESLDRRAGSRPSCRVRPPDGGIGRPARGHDVVLRRRSRGESRSASRGRPDTTCGVTGGRLHRDARLVDDEDRSGRAARPSPAPARLEMPRAPADRERQQQRARDEAAPLDRAQVVAPGDERRQPHEVASSQATSTSQPKSRSRQQTQLSEDCHRPPRAGRRRRCGRRSH